MEVHAEVSIQTEAFFRKSHNVGACSNYTTNSSSEFMAVIK